MHLKLYIERENMRNDANWKWTHEGETKKKKTKVDRSIKKIEIQKTRSLEKILDLQMLLGVKKIEWNWGK